MNKKKEKIQEQFIGLLSEMQQRFNEQYAVDQAELKEHKNASALDYFLWTHEEVMENTTLKHIAYKEPEPPRPSKYAVAFSGTDVSTGVVRQFLEIVDAFSVEEAIGKFVHNFRDKEFYLGAFKATKIDLF